MEDDQNGSPNSVDSSVSSDETNQEPTDAQLASEPATSEQDSEPQSVENAPIEPAPPVPKPKKSKKLLVLFVLLLLVAGASAVWFFLMRDKVQAPQTTESATTQLALRSSTPLMPVSVAYSFREKTTDPLKFYTRPAAGGDRKEVQVFGISDHAQEAEVYGQSVAVVLSEDIWLSNDGGTKYTRIVDNSGKAQITSLKFSADGSRIAFGYLASVAGKNTVKSIDLTGKDSKDLFTSDKAGVFIGAWDDKSQQIIYSEGCYNCDGNVTNHIVLRNLKTNASKSLGSETASVRQLVTNRDFASLVYVEETVHDDIAVEGLPGKYVGAPYKLYRYDMKQAKATLLATVGTDADAAKQVYYQVNTGFLADGTTPYYTNNKQFFVVKDNKPSLVFEAAQDIRAVHYASDKTIIAEVLVAPNSQDFNVVNYNVDTKVSTTILQGDANTRIFGVTTKQ